MHRAPETLKRVAGTIPEPDAEVLFLTTVETKSTQQAAERRQTQEAPACALPGDAGALPLRTYELLYPLVQLHVVLRDHRDGAAGATGASGATHSVDVVLGGGGRGGEGRAGRG